MFSFQIFFSPVRQSTVWSERYYRLDVFRSRVVRQKSYTKAVILFAIQANYSLKKMLQEREMLSYVVDAIVYDGCV